MVRNCVMMSRASRVGVGDTKGVDGTSLEERKD